MTKTLIPVKDLQATVPHIQSADEAGCVLRWGTPAQASFEVRYKGDNPEALASLDKALTLALQDAAKTLGN